MIVFIATASAVIAQDDAADGQFVITKIEVEGLEQTKPYIVTDVLQKYIGMDSREIDINEVYAKIADLNIIEPDEIEIVPNETGQTLLANITDKWPYIGFPLFLMSSDGFITAGLMALNMNVWGIGDRFFAVGMWNADYHDIDTTSGGNAMINYSHNTRNMFLPKWVLALNYTGGKTFKVTNQEADTLHQWKADNIRVSSTFRYELFDKLFTPSLGILFSNTMLRKSDIDILPPDADSMSIDLAPSVAFRRSNFDGFLMSEKSASLNYTLRIGLETETTDHIDFLGKYEQSILPGFKFTSNAIAVYSLHAKMVSGLYPSAMGMRIPVAAILPSTYMVYHYFGANTGVEKYIYRWKYLMVSMLLNYQVIGTYTPDLDWQFDHGFGVGVSLYLPRVAIPAIKATANYNIPRNHFSAAFSVGVSF
ncbi:MAG: hypothetical protein LBT01_07070 [Spirochaetaceae bacterium]|nr:hypothetical protein [Spirochaetaceae bacterium]